MDAAKGQAIGSTVCAACHGPDGNSIGAPNPKLAGQIPDYLAKQLANFKPAAAGKPAERNNAIMAGFAATLSPGGTYVLSFNSDDSQWYTVRVSDGAMDDAEVAIVSWGRFPFAPI